MSLRFNGIHESSGGLKCGYDAGRDSNDQKRIVDNMLRTWIVEPDVWLVSDFLGDDDALAALHRINDEVRWRQHIIRMFGREIPSPRLTAFQGDDRIQYSYSGITLEAAPWSPAVADVRGRMEDVVGRPFNSVLINKYRDGSDSMGWHADDENELGQEPVIASVSLGDARRFLLRNNETGVKRETMLTSGSLLVMGGRSQHDWKHAVPKTKRDVGERINLTFRQISC